MPRKWYQSEIIDIQVESDTTKRFFLQIDDPDLFSFKAGQFITMDLPIGEKRFERWRSYSICSAPSKNNILEFCIVKTDPGHATKYLFNETEIGTNISFKGPEGNFCLNAPEDSEIIMICTGTGVAPFRSMLLDGDAVFAKYKKLHLIFGTRNFGGILFLDEFLSLMEKHPNFDYSIALSREEYKGYKGYVHNIYKDRYSEVAANRVFYLCGWQNMVDEAVKNLVNLGYEKNQIIQELYG
jgi:CDP-4-dehydro-6-deoxyglucose reductase